MIVQVVKAVGRKVLLVPGVTWPFSLLLRSRAVIFMLHRFRVPDLGVEGHDPDHVGKTLEFLRRKRFEFVPLAEMFARLSEGRVVRRTVAFTLDDGYLDQGTVAAEAFRRYDCPATTFVTTGFLDGALWFWWDQIEYIFNHTDRRDLCLQLSEMKVKYAREDGAGWRTAQEDFIARCKGVADADRAAGVLSLSRAAEVEIPVQPPACYAPMSWDQARDCERRGMTFGPHTVSHPILSRITDDQCSQEITDSWNQLRGQVLRPVPIFCYPNGGLQDFGSREIEVLRRVGLKGAVVGYGGYTETGSLARSPDAAFKISRFSYPDSFTDLVQIAGGVLRFREIMGGAG